MGDASRSGGPPACLGHDGNFALLRLSNSRMLPERRSTCALIASLVAHAAFIATTGVVAAGQLAGDGSAGVSLTEVVAESGGGDTFDIEGLIDEGPASTTPGDQVAPSADQDPASHKETEAPPEATPPAEAPAQSQAAPAAEPAAPPPPSPPPEPPRVDAIPKSPADSSPSGEQRAAGRTEATRGDAASAPGGPGQRRVWGAEGAGRGIRPLARDFARAVPAAVSADRIWSRLPLGPAGRVEITIVLDDAGKIQSVRVPDDAPRQLERLVERTLALLRAGRFVLTSVEGAGEETLRIEVELSQRAPIEGEHLKPYHALNLGHEPPAPGQPGKAYFTLASGRHFEATVTIVASKARGST